MVYRNMPGLITHYLCAEAAANGLGEGARRVIGSYKGLYRVGAQGPDIFFYYVPGFIGGTFPKIGTQMHRGGVSELAGAVADKLAYLGKTGAVERKERLLAYFAGYLTHYCLDYTAHPYIYYKTGFSKNGKSTPKSSAAHRKFETSVDVAMLSERRGIKPKDTRLWRLLAVKREDASDLSKTMAEIINRVYVAGITAGQVRRSIAVARFCARALQSGRGRRARFLCAIEDIAGCPGAVSGLIHPQGAGKNDPLNITKKQWALPYDKDARRDDSFIEMFELAVNRARDMIAALFGYAENINGGVSKRELLDIIGDNSLKTGADAGSGVVFRYCEGKGN